MGLASIKIPDSEFETLRAAAQVHGRSIAGQAAHWLRLGRAFEQDPAVPYSRVDQALKRLISPDTLDDAEWGGFMDLMAEPGDKFDRFLSDMKTRGVGVGLDENDHLVYQTKPF